MTKTTNYIIFEFLSRSANEGFARSAVAAFAAQLDPTLEELGDIKTAVSEAVTNAIVHAYPDTLGRIVVKAKILEGNVLEISVRDWGRGIPDVEQARQPLYTTGGEERSGMGFTIMESFMDKLSSALPRGKAPRSPCAGGSCPARRGNDRRHPGSPGPGPPGGSGGSSQVLEENSGLIWAVVRRYYGRGAEPEDLYQLGCLGFLKAVQGFDRAYGTQFSTYAVPKIAGEIRRYLRDNGAIKVSRGLREQSLAIYAAREQLRSRLGREPALSELSEATGLAPEEIAVAELAAAAPDSLQQENAEGLTLESTLADSAATEEALVERIALRSAIDALPEQEQKTILLRFYKGLTQQQCARILGVSQVQVSRLEKRALDHLRRDMG